MIGRGKLEPGPGRDTRHKDGYEANANCASCGSPIYVANYDEADARYYRCRECAAATEPPYDQPKCDINIKVTITEPGTDEVLGSGEYHLLDLNRANIPHLSIEALQDDLKIAWWAAKYDYNNLRNPAAHSSPIKGSAAARLQGESDE
jgi:hypothetical protein